MARRPSPDGDSPPDEGRHPGGDAPPGGGTPPGGDVPPGEGGEPPISLLLLWAEAVADFACLPARRRAGVLARLAEEVRAALAAAPDKELIYPWQIRQVNQAFGCEVIPVPPRAWRFGTEPGRMRVIGD